jgi:hypothetical protein
MALNAMLVLAKVDPRLRDRYWTVAVGDLNDSSAANMRSGRKNQSVYDSIRRNHPATRGGPEGDHIARTAWKRKILKSGGIADQHRQKETGR